MTFSHLLTPYALPPLPALSSLGFHPPLPRTPTPHTTPQQKLTGSADGLLAAQRSPQTPMQRMAAHHKEVAELVSEGVAWLWRQSSRGNTHALAANSRV